MVYFASKDFVFVEKLPLTVTHFVLIVCRLGLINGENTKLAGFVPAVAKKKKIENTVLGV